VAELPAPGLEHTDLAAQIVEDTGSRETRLGASRPSE